MVFDMTPEVETIQNYIQVGIGERNPEFKIGNKYNNKNYEDSYDRSKHVNISMNEHVMDYNIPEVDPNHTQTDSKGYNLKIIIIGVFSLSILLCIIIRIICYCNKNSKNKNY